MCHDGFYDLKRFDEDFPTYRGWFLRYALVVGPADEWPCPVGPPRPL